MGVKGRCGAPFTPFTLLALIAPKQPPTRPRHDTGLGPLLFERALALDGADELAVLFALLQDEPLLPTGLFELLLEALDAISALL